MTIHKPGTATANLLIENDLTRVTEWQFDKHGDNTGWHRHEYDYVVVPLFNGNLEMILPNGSRQQVQMKEGAAYFRPAGVEHDVISVNSFACRFIEIEFLNKATVSR